MRFLHVFVAFSALIVSGCAVRHPVMPLTLSQYTPPLAASRWYLFGENAAEREIRRALLELPYFSVFDYLAYRVEGRQVTLYGAVMEPELRDDAESVVKSIGGIDRVYNLIRFLPDSPHDNQVRQKLFGAVYGDRILARYALIGGGAIRIVEDRGSVVLEGQVATEADRLRAAALAASVPGVATLSSHLQVVD
jgi:osmotically-inducible protein OsmY